MNLTWRSKLITRPIATFFLPDMKNIKASDGDTISNDAMYCLEADRSDANSEHTYFKNLELDQMRKNAIWSWTRFKLVTRSYKIATLISWTGCIAGILIVNGIYKTESGIQHASSFAHSLHFPSFYSSPTDQQQDVADQNSEKLQDLKAQEKDLLTQAQDYISQHNAGKIDQATFESKTNDLKQKYRALQIQEQQLGAK